MKKLLSLLLALLMVGSALWLAACSGDTEQTGNTPAKYLSDKRFEQLCYLLTTDMTDGEIAERMSFSSVASMNAFFKRIASTTPQRFRKNRYFVL